MPPPPGMMPSRISGWPNRALAADDPEVAGEGQLAAAAQGEAVDGGDGGPGDGGHGVEGGAEGTADRAGLVGPAELADVGAGGEHPRRAGDHHGAGRIVGERLGGVAELAEHGGAQRVDLPVVEPEDGDAALDLLDVDEGTLFVSHRISHGG